MENSMSFFKVLNDCGSAVSTTNLQHFVPSTCILRVGGVYSTNVEKRDPTWKFPLDAQQKLTTGLKDISGSRI